VLLTPRLRSPHGQLPPIHYLTLLDKFTLLNSALIVLVALESRLLSMIVEFGGGYDGSLDVTVAEYGPFDAVCSLIFATMWLVVHIYFIGLGWRLRTHADRYQFDLNWHHADGVPLIDDEGREVTEQQKDDEKNLRRMIKRSATQRLDVMTDGMQASERQLTAAVGGAKNSRSWVPSPSRSKVSSRRTTGPEPAPAEEQDDAGPLAASSGGDVGAPSAAQQDQMVTRTMVL